MADANLFLYALLAIFIGAIVAFTSYVWSTNCGLYEGFSYVKALANSLSGSGQMAGFRNEENFASPMRIPNKPDMKESFVAVGAGLPNCMSTSKDCAALYEMLSTRTVKTEEGPDDLRELQLILSKISCFKRDLMGAAGVVEATRYQPFSTAHDLEPVAETTARCFAKTIPQRDLALGLDKWGGRGTFLIKRLCTAQNLSDAEEHEALRLFGDAMADINDIALGACCTSSDAVIAGQKQPRMVGGFEPPSLEGLRKYEGYY